MKPFTRILVPTDFSDCAEDALLRAIDLRQRYGATLTLLHIYQIPVTYPGYVFAEGIIQAVQESAQAQLAKAKAWAENEEKKSGQASPASEIETQLRIGVPSQTILSEIEDAHYDLVVMGTHGSTGIKHLILGSVAERIVRRAPCPVLTVRGTPRG